LRSAIAAATESCELFEQLATAQAKLDPMMARCLVHSCAAFVIELRRNREHSSELRTYVDATTDVQWFKFLNSGNPAKDYLVSFDSKFGYGKECEIIKSKAILDFVEKGTCDLEQLLQDLVVNRPKDTSVPAYRRLSRYRTLSKSDFDKLANDALKEVNTTKMRSFQEIAESGQILFHLVEKKLIGIPAVDLRILYVECISLLAEEYLSGSSDIKFDFDQSMLFGNITGEFCVVIDQIQKKIGELERERFSREKFQKIAELAKDPDAFVATLNSVDSQIATSACLEIDDAHQICQILIELVKSHSSPHIHIYKLQKAIVNRYINSSVNVKFHSEIHFIERLLKQIEFIHVKEITDCP